MATKRKKSKKNSPDKKPARSGQKSFPTEKEEKIDLKALAGDERTWKIVGTFLLLISLFLFVSFTSYLFTWKEDMDVARQGLSALFNNDRSAENLLGRLGAVVSGFFIFNGFGLASFLICTFFFVVGVNLLFRQKVFSIWRNLKYVTIGLLVLSVSLAFIFGNSGFPFGGAVGNLVSGKLTGALGNLGTAAVLFLLALGYFIWQFNPSFGWPSKKQESIASDKDTAEKELQPIAAGTTINDLYMKGEKTQNGNSLSSKDSMVINFPDDKPMHDFEVIEKEEMMEEQDNEVIKKKVISQNHWSNNL